ncbi:MFS general substrate transporter [Paramyrothecium foliicola]|nr:MFS general substrate transporter [Paramyrothecium foliicola]
MGRHKPGMRIPEEMAESDKEKALANETPLTASDNEPPDGGATAWLVILGAWCASFCAYGWINTVGTFQVYYETGPLRNYSSSEISWIPSLQIFFMSFLGPIIGRIYDKYGLRLLVGVGSLMHVFGLMMASLSTEYYQFLLSQGVCSAIGVAAVFMCAITTISEWFTKRRGLAFGVMATGASVGGVVFPIMISNMIRTVGYGWAMRTAAFIILALLIVTNLTLRSRRSRVQIKLPKGSLLRPFREPTFVVLLAGLFLVPFGLYVPITYIPTVAMGDGMSNEMAQNLVAIYNASSLFGRLGSGYISDKLGKFNSFVVSCSVAGTLILALWIPASGTAATVTFVVLFGLFSGAYISLMAALVAQISPLEELGYRNGLTFFGSAIGGLITSPIAGAILEGPGSWNGLKIFAGVMMLNQYMNGVLRTLSTKYILQFHRLSVMVPVIKQVALAGATGQLGTRILAALIATGRFKITVLTRNAATASCPDGVIVKEVDYSSIESLTDAIKGQDAVIDSTYSYESEAPRRLIDAVIAAGVYRYIPPEFGSDPKSEAVQALPFFQRKTETAKYLQERLKNSYLTWTAVACGPFLEALGDGGLGIDLRAKKIAMFGQDGHITTPFSTLEAIGKATAQVLLHPEETSNRVVYISSVALSQKRLVGLALEALGSEGWEQSTLDVQKDHEDAQKRLQQGEFSEAVIFAFLRHSMTSPLHTYVWEVNDNELLGVEQLSDDQIKDIMKKIAGVV